MIFRLDSSFYIQSDIVFPHKYYPLGSILIWNDEELFFSCQDNYTLSSCCTEILSSMEDNKKNLEKQWLKKEVNTQLALLADAFFDFKAQNLCVIHTAEVADDGLEIRYGVYNNEEYIYLSKDSGYTWIRKKFKKGTFLKAIQEMVDKLRLFGRFGNLNG